MANCSAAIESGKEDDNTLANLYFNRGNLYLAKGEHDPALADYTNAVRLLPTYIAARLNRAWIYLQIGRCDNAIADYDAVLMQEPKSAFALFGRGTAYRLEDEAARAEADVATAKAIDAKVEQKFGDVRGVMCGRP